MKQSWTRGQKIFVVALLLAILSVILWVSRSELEKNGLKENIVIKGKIIGAQGLQIYLEAPSNRGTISIAQTEIEADGTFEIPANIPGLGIYNLRLSDLNGSTLWLPLQPKDELSLEAKLNSFSIEPGIKGVAWAKTYKELMEATKEFEELQSSLQQMSQQVSQDSLTALYGKAKNKYEGFCSRAILNDLNSPLNILLSMNLLPTTGFEDWNTAHLQTLQKLSDAYTLKYANQPASQNMQAQYHQIEDAYFAFTQTTNGSMVAPDINLLDPQQKMLSLSSLKGKYVLIDFWASWCGPCKSEMPNVIALYNKYKNKGFTIYSVSLDDNASKWKEAIKTWGMSWTNHVSDLKGWDSDMPALYHFDGIPYTVLINPDGKIIGTNLRGAKLQEKLASIFN